MFCSGCGAEIVQGLNFCNRCGKRLIEEGPTTFGIPSDTAKAVGYIGAAGFFAYIFVVFVFLKAGGPANQLIPISMFYFGALFGVSAMLIYYSSGRIMPGANVQSKEKDPNETASPQFLNPPTTAQLEEPHDMGIGSVTEHTTRTLDEVPFRER